MSTAATVAVGLPVPSGGPVSAVPHPSALLARARAAHRLACALSEAGADAYSAANLDVAGWTAAAGLAGCTFPSPETVSATVAVLLVAELLFPDREAAAA